MVVFCCQTAAILRHLLYHIGNFHPLFTRHVVGSVGDVGLLLRFPCFSEQVCRTFNEDRLHSQTFLVLKCFEFI